MSSFNVFSHSMPVFTITDVTLRGFLSPSNTRNIDGSSTSTASYPVKVEEKNMEIIGCGYALAIGRAGAVALLGEIDSIER